MKDDIIYEVDGKQYLIIKDQYFTEGEFFDVCRRIGDVLE